MAFLGRKRKKLVGTKMQSALSDNESNMFNDVNVIFRFYSLPTVLLIEVNSSEREL